ncbi:PhnA domain-containing protein [Colwellia sp. MEBiC06753]
MSIEQALITRSGGCCELCTSQNDLTVYHVPPSEGNDQDQAIYICGTCASQISGDAEYDMNHWRCLNDSMWSQVPAVQVVAYRMLHQLSTEGWAQDLLDMMYLEDDVKSWAEKAMPAADAEPTLDCNGTHLQAGDTVHLVKDLVVKGANFTAKRGTAVRNISLSDNPLHIEGRVNGTRIVIIADYVKKSV